MKWKTSIYLLMVSKGQKYRSSFSCVILNKGLSWGGSQVISLAPSSDAVPEAGGFAPKMTHVHAWQLMLAVSLLLHMACDSSGPLQQVSLNILFLLRWETQREREV